jgi:V/A-type H+-transporting ATPase subunit E
MEGVSKINKKIMNEAITEANGIISEAKEKSAELKRVENEKTNSEKKVIQETGKKNSAREEQRILSSANLKAHNLRLQSTDTMINEAITKAETQLKRMSKDNTGRYKKALKILAKQGIEDIGTDSVLHFNEENLGAGKEIAKELGTKAEKNKELLGGVIIENTAGDLRIDNSIERILERDSEKIRGKVAKILFKSKT